MPPRELWIRRILTASTAVVGVALLGVTGSLFVPLFSAASSDQPALAHATTPAFDYGPWQSLAVQDGRTKPFQSACIEAVRQITGRSRFEGLDPVAIVLAWMLDEGAGIAPGGTTWENHPFVLCDHHGVRRQILEHDGAAQPIIGKYLSPAELRRSPGFDRLLDEVGRKRKELKGRAHLELSSEHLKAEEVGRRLLLFDALCGKGSTQLFRNALVGDTFLDLRAYANIADTSPDNALAQVESKQSKLSDPFHLVGLDRVGDSGWFSLAELRALRRDPARWQTVLAARMRERPERYLDRASREKLEGFQEAIRRGEGSACLDEVTSALTERRESALRRFEAADRAGDRAKANIWFLNLAPGPQEQARFQQAQARQPKGTAAASPVLLEELRAIAQAADAAVIQRLARGIEAAEQRGSADTDLRMLQLDYLESLFPDLYRDALAAQPMPRQAIDEVLAAIEEVRRAYRAGSSEEFDRASLAFFAVVARTTDDRSDGATFVPYPGVTTIPLELEFERWQPFLWSWITMFAALAILALSLGAGSRWGYSVGMIVYLCSLAIQTAGFSLRIAISSRAPVSNMYETVIFTAFMAAVFAGVLELLYRRGYFALAGAAVATLGLVLADQLPLALDPKISPIVPVLRTNYWLTVHVLTIVSSYAAGTLAWGLGNLTLVLLVFGKHNEDTLKTLANFTYRAMQIAVLLLAAGTFLGGWWAAESWGRFWGWDPKEVGALIALVCYVIPLHARYLGWVREFGLAVAAVLCYASILLSWYVVNFLVAAGLHSYGFGAGGGTWVLWACLLNIEWLLIASLLHQRRKTVS